jgi:hypothetical protein
MRAAVAVVVAAGCRHGAAPAPAPPCPGDAVVVSSQETLDALAGCQRLAGLTLRGGAPYDLAPLASLARVDGELVIGPTLAMASIGLPALATVGGRLAIVSNGSAGGVFAPALVTVGALEVRDNASLTTLSVPRLANVAGALTLVRNDALEMVDASSLAAPLGPVQVAVRAAVTWLGDRPDAATSITPHTMSGPP